MQDLSPVFITNIEQETLANEAYRTVLWTGAHIQMTVMSILPGDDIGLEVHDTHDQFLRIESGRAKALTGPSEHELVEQDMTEDEVILVPAGTWHNLVNVSDEPLKVYSIYGPAEHASGAIHETKADAEAAEHEH